MTEKIAVVGAGAWGTTIAKILAENGHAVKLWCYLDDMARGINDSHRTPLLPDVILPDSVVASSTLSEVVSDSTVMVIGLSSSQLSVLDDPAVASRSSGPVLLLTKGFMDGQPSFFVSDFVKSKLNTDQVAVLSGPNLASEIAAEKPAASVVASLDDALASRIQVLLSNVYFRVYRSMDIRGVESGGILKNVIAIAAGISEGLSLGTNATSALITRGLQEMVSIGERLGGKRETFFGLSGLGDLVTTCSSSLSRNCSLGQALALSDRPVKDVLASLTNVTEGVKTAKVVHQIAQAERLELPIMSGVYRVLYENKSPRDVIQGLMRRMLKAE